MIAAIAIPVVLARCMQYSACRYASGVVAVIADAAVADGGLADTNFNRMPK
jgi:hypothetical protein